MKKSNYRKIKISRDIYIQIILLLLSFRQYSFSVATAQKPKYDIELTEKSRTEIDPLQDYDPYKNRNVTHPTTYVDFFFF